ncbi:MAG: peptidylprolyl isomerase [Candidatus Kapaibacterium sp.]|nr:peptidylprolyl isomerase [Bacteroidota bacterium]
MTIRSLIILCSFFVAYSISAVSQTLREGDVLDKIAAVVGKEIILKSEVDGQLYMIAQQNKELNINDPSIRRKVIDAIVNDRLLYNKAIEDSIIVSDEEITAQLDATIQQMIAQVGSEARLVEIYGMPIWKIRQNGRDEIKKRLLMERIRQTKFMELKVTQREVEDFYKQYRDSLPEVGEQVELYHIVKYITPSTATKEKALQKSKRIRDSIANGGDFCDFAKRYSSDAGSAESCGELGLRNCTDFVPEFCAASKKLQVMEISLPVETPFGYHIIQLMDRTKDQIHTRHILISVPRQDEDLENVKKQLAAIKSDFEKGTMKFEDIAKMASDEKETQGFGGYLGKLSVGTLDASLKAAVSVMKDNSVSEALVYQADRTKPALHIVYRKKTIPSHKPNLESDYKEIERMAQSFKQNAEYEKWIISLRAQMHWEVRD